jgi:hypothetical protein
MRFLADENFNNRILRGIRREHGSVDIQRVQDTEVYQAEDPAVLAFAAAAGRILLTHDIKTMPRYAYDRVKAGQPMPGVVAIPEELSIGAVIADMGIIMKASTAQDFDNQVVYLPL